MKKHIYFITGTSRGIGEALGLALVAGENIIHCFSRSGSASVVQASSGHAAVVFDHQIDLAQTGESAQYFDQLFSELKPESVASVTLIQNAGLLTPMGKIGDKPDLSELEVGMKVNLLTPMMINEQFIHRFQDWNVPKKIVNISTGAARNPYVAWNMYCSSKAGLDMHSRVIATEQEAQAYPIQVVALAPGIVDTAMQDLIRSQTVETFPMLDKFIELKEEGLLVSPAQVAQQMLDLLTQDDFGQEVLIDLRG